MKKRVAGFLACLLVGIRVMAADADYHTFTDTAGHSIQAKLLKLDESTGQIFIETADGKKLWADPSVFSGESGVYIQRWMQVERFLSNQCLCISIKKSIKDDKLRYELIMENRAQSPLPALTVDYVIYIKQDRQNGAKDGMRYIGGTIAIDDGDSLEKVVKATQVVTLAKRFVTMRTSNGAYIPTLSKDEPMGVWFKIYGPLLDGVPSVRDVSYPNTLKENVAWAEHVFMTRKAESMLGAVPETDLDSMLDGIQVQDPDPMSTQ